jgi:hypothetical protein
MLVMLIALSSVPAIGQADNTILAPARTIDGRVRLVGHGPLPLDVTVRLEEAEGVYVTQQFVGNDGRFRFDDLKGNMYRIVVTARGIRQCSKSSKWVGRPAATRRSTWFR